MDRYRFAGDLFDLRFYSEYNVLLQQTLGESALWWQERTPTFGILVLSLIALCCSVALVKLTKKDRPWWVVCNCGSVGGALLALIAALWIIACNPSGIAAKHFEMSSKWQDILGEIQEVGDRFKTLAEDEPVEESYLTAVAEIKRKRAVIEKTELALPSPSKRQEKDCYAVIAERTYGEGITSQEKIDQLKRDNFERWARMQFAVDPKQRPSAIPRSSTDDRSAGPQRPGSS
jgi:hypothetical protein